MPERLLSTVNHKTVVESGFLACAAHQAMSAYLEDWEAAYEALGRRIEQLRKARDERKAATEAGAWPFPRSEQSAGAS